MSISLTLTLSGGAALGAYEAGATAAAMEAVHVLQREDQDVTIDAFGGASGGALVAMFAAHALANDIDPVWLLREAWVDRVSLELLKGKGLESPFGFDRLIDRIDDLLDPRDDTGSPAHRRGHPPAGPARADRPAPVDHPVGLHVALTGLRGLHYQVRGLGSLNPVKAATYADWGGFTLHPGSGVAGITEPAGHSILDFVLASAANAMVFAPRALDRRQDVQGYTGNGIEDLPASGRLWYTDGGTLQVEPIGRVLTAARNVRQAAGRPQADRHVTLLVDPRSEMPSEAEMWSGDRQPSWMEGIARTLAIIPAQILYDDLRRVEKMNSRQSWAARLTTTLAGHLNREATSDLAALLRQLDDEVDQLRAGEKPDSESGVDDASDAAQLLEHAFSLIGGLDSKLVAEVDVISPLLLAGDSDAHVTGLLAGEILGDFGGFLDRDLRESDFLLGYDSTLSWLPSNLPRLGVPDAATQAAIEAVRDRVPHRWSDRNRGKTELENLPWGVRLKLAGLVMRMVGVLAKDALKSLRSG